MAKRNNNAATVASTVASVASVAPETLVQSPEETSATPVQTPVTPATPVQTPVTPVTPPVTPTTPVTPPVTPVHDAMIEEAFNIFELQTLGVEVTVEEKTEVRRHMGGMIERNIISGKRDEKGMEKALANFSKAKGEEKVREHSRMVGEELMKDTMAPFIKDLSDQIETIKGELRKEMEEDMEKLKKEMEAQYKDSLKTIRTEIWNMKEELKLKDAIIMEANNVNSINHPKDIIGEGIEKSSNGHMYEDGRLLDD